MADRDGASQRYMSLREAAGRVGVSTRTLERQVKSGDGPPVTRIGRRVLFNVDALDRWVARCTAQVPA